MKHLSSKELMKQSGANYYQFLSATRTGILNRVDGNNGQGTRAKYTQEQADLFKKWIYAVNEARKIKKVLKSLGLKAYIMGDA